MVGPWFSQVASRVVPSGPLYQQAAANHSAAHHDQETHGPTRVHIPNAHRTGLIGQGATCCGEGSQGALEGTG